MLLKEKLLQANREASKAKHEALMREKEKEALVDSHDRRRKQILWPKA